MSSNNTAYSLCEICKNNTMVISSKSGEYACSRCGYVSPIPFIDTTAEYRQFAMDHGVKDRTHTAFAGEDGENELGTTFGYDGKKHTKDLIDINNRVTTDPKIANLKKSVKRIRSICNDLKLEKMVSDSACKYYKDALEKNILKSHKKEAIYGAIILGVCKNEERALTIEELLSSTTGIDQRDIMNAQKVLQEIGIEGGVKIYVLAKRYCDDLQFPPYVGNAAEKIGKFAIEVGIKGKTQTVAGGIAMFLNKLMKPDKQKPEGLIENLSNTKEATLRKVFGELNEIRERLYRLPEVQTVLEQNKT